MSKKKKQTDNPEMVKRLRLPKDGELFGIVEHMMGASRMMVRCADDKLRTVRIPGKLKKRIWIREGDVIIVQPWTVQSDKKGDVVWRYTKPQVDRLIRQGMLGEIKK